MVAGGSAHAECTHSHGLSLHPYDGRGIYGQRFCPLHVPQVRHRRRRRWPLLPACIRTISTMCPRKHESSTLLSISSYHSFFRCRSLRTPANTFVMNLAISDWLMMTKIPIIIYQSFLNGPALGAWGELRCLFGGVHPTTRRILR